jgi:hypothetical protein
MSDRSAFTTPITVKLSAILMSTVELSREATVRVWPDTRTIVPRTRIGTCAGATETDSSTRPAASASVFHLVLIMARVPCPRRRAAKD